MKITRSSAVQHPEGWFLFKIDAEEETRGKYGLQIKWTLRSEVNNEETGEPLVLAYYTGTALSAHEKCKLTDLFIACGILASRRDLEEMTEGDFDAMDSGLALGKIIEGRVDAPATEGGYCNIGAVRARKTTKHKVTPPRQETHDLPDGTAKHRVPVEAEEFLDPFDESYQ